MIAEVLHPLMVMKSDEHEQGPFRYRPSLAGPERCIRALTYARIGQKKDTKLSGRMLMIFESGQWNEEVLASMIDQTAFHLHSRQMEVTCWEDSALCLKGHIDGVLTDPMGVDRLWETKGINHFTWGRWASGESFPMDYFVQCALYIRGLHALNPALREGILTIRNKNTDQLLDFLLDYDYVTDRLEVFTRTMHTGESILVGAKHERIVQNAVEKFKLVEAYASEGRLPDRPMGFSPDEFPCSYCPWNGKDSTCWKGFAAETVEGGEVVLSASSNAELFAGQYLEISERAKLAQKDKEDYRDKLLTIMREKKATKATAGSFTISRSVQQREGRLNFDVMSEGMKRMVENYRGAAQVVEVLRVSRKKEGT